MAAVARTTEGRRAHCGINKKNGLVLSFAGWRATRGRLGPGGVERQGWEHQYEPGEERIGAFPKCPTSARASAPVTASTTAPTDTNARSG